MIAKIANRRESFRAHIREAEKQSFLREKRAMLIEASDKGAQTAYQSERELALIESLRKVESLDDVCRCLEQLKDNRIRDRPSLECLQTIAYRLIGITDNPRSICALNLIKLIVFEYMSLPDATIKESLPIIYQFIKSKYFFDLFTNVSLIKDWGNGEGISNKLKENFIQIFLIQLEQREVTTGQDIDIIESFLLSGEIPSAYCYRFVNIINFAMSMEIVDRLQEKHICSLINCIRIMADSSRHQASNIGNCSYILPALEKLLKSSNLARILCGIMRTINKLIWDTELLQKLLMNNPTLLLNITQQLNKTHKELLTLTCFTLSNIAAFEEGTSHLLDFGIQKKVLEIYEGASNSTIKNEAAYVLINILSRANSTYRLQLLAEEQLESIVVDIVKDGYQLSWVKPELVELTLDSLAKILSEEDGIEISRRLSQRKASHCIQALLHSNNPRISQASCKFFDSIQQQTFDNV